MHKNILIPIFIFFILVIQNSIFSESYCEDLAVNEQVNITLLKNGEKKLVPAFIGIDKDLWRDHSLDSYSVEPKKKSPLYTDKYDGIVHIESTYNRKFTLANFLDIWGIDQSKIKKVIANDNSEIKDYKKYILTNGTKLILQIKDDLFPKKSSEYKDLVSGLTLQYPTTWNVMNYSEIPLSSSYSYKSVMDEKFLNLIELFPNESIYMKTPYFKIAITQLPTNKVGLDNYTIEKFPILLQADKNKFPKYVNSTTFNFNDNPARKIFLDTDLIVEPGDSVYGNNVTQNTMLIWIKNNSFIYDISYSALTFAYDDYFHIIEKILNSIRFEKP